MNRIHMNYQWLLGSIVLLLSTSTAYSQPGLDDEQIKTAYYKSYTYETSGNYNDAIKALQLVYQAYPKSYGVNNRLGDLYRFQAQFKNSEHHYKRAISALPDALSPKLGLMYTYLLAQRYDDASKLGYQILRIDYYNYYGNLRLGHVLRKMGNTELAEAVLLKMLLRYPSDTLYLTELALLTLERGETERTRKIMAEVLILDPENVTAKSVLHTLPE